MVDFRKWLLALAVVGLLLGVGSSAAYAQASFTCAATAVPNIVRAEGITELLGDLILNCTGGLATNGGQPIPLQNVVITVGGTNVTSRIVGGPPGSSTFQASEALLLIDEPYPTTPVPAGAPKDVTNPPLTQLACLAINNTNCAISSLGTGGLGATGSYNGTPGHFNVFQGVQQGANSVSWSGVPIDAPGTAGTRVIRITNIRANASALGASSTLIPTTISESIFVNGTQIIALNQPPTGSVVGNVSPGLVSSVPLPGPGAYQQCVDVNTYLLSPPGHTTTDSGIVVTATEGFRYSFKEQNYAQTLALLNGIYQGPGQPVHQNVLNFPYSTESGFTPDATVVNSTTETVGYADRGTQIQFAVAGLSSGVTLYAPSYVYLTGAYGAGTIQGVAVLVSQNGGSGAVTTSIPVQLQGGTVQPAAPVVPITSSGTTASLVYEIYYADPSVLETLAVPISVEYVSNTASNTPAPGTTTVAVGFYPTSTVITADATAPIPRFIPSATSKTLFSISLCSCNLLFPFVSNVAGFNTGVAIANTSADPYGTAPQSGTVTLSYYGGSNPPPAATSTPVAAGQELIFDLLDGNTAAGIAATPGFQGYIIAQANFQYCHGFAFISDVGAQHLAEGYLAISLDVPVVTVNGALPTGLNRTGNSGENEGH